jgi:hypothetical protein
MADKDAVKFETSVEKLVADYASSVNDVIEDMKSKVRALNMDLGKQMSRLDVPAKGTVKEIAKLIEGVVAAETKSFRGFVDVKIDLEFDEKSRKPGGCAVESTGTYLKL